MAQYWLCKTEPETYSFAQLVKDKRTNWNEVRNYQARNNLRKMAQGDIVLIYHSGDDKAVVGSAKVVRDAYPDIDADDGREWTQVDLVPINALKQPVSLAKIKSTKALADLPLIKQSRLSVMPITKEHYNLLIELGTKS
jgi:predicted RNA-binding protein with PUA-like domain